MCQNTFGQNTFGPVVRLHACIHSCDPRMRARRSAAKGFCSQGNTAIYLLYTHARISSILARATEQVRPLPRATNPVHCNDHITARDCFCCSVREFKLVDHLTILSHIYIYILYFSSLQDFASFSVDDVVRAHTPFCFHDG